MNEPGDDAFARSRFTLQEHCAVRLRESLDGLINTQDGLALATKKLGGRTFLGDSRQQEFATSAALFQRLGNQDQNAFCVKRLGEKRDNALLQGG